MQKAIPIPAPATSRWSSRVALFGLIVLISAFVLHRLLGMPTPTAALLFAISLGCAILSILLGMLAAVRIWQRGAPGGARVMFGFALSLMILAIPLFTIIAAAGYPAINDITTDPLAPPEFVALARDRPPGSNSPVYAGPSFAEAQSEAYPDIRPITIDRSAEEAFELVVDAVKRMKMEIVRQEPPGAAPDAPGAIEASDRTLVFGFYDDVVIRVTGDEERARVDMRSQSRFGESDLGRNAERLRLLAYEIQVRVDATMPAAGEARPKKKGKGDEAPKRGKGDDRKPEARRKSQAPAP